MTPVITNPYRFTAAVVPTLQIDYDGTDGFTKTGTTVAVDDVSKCVFTNGVTDDRESVAFTALSDTKWYVDFQYKWTGGVSTAHFTFFLSPGTASPSVSITHEICLLNGASGAMILCTNDGTNGFVQSAVTHMVAVSTTLYYCRLERVSATQARMSFFTDSDRTTHLTNSPKTVTLDSGLTGIDSLVHGCQAGLSGARTVNSEFQAPTLIYDGVNP